jgi:transposase
MDERLARQEAKFNRQCAEQAAEVERCHRELVLAARCGSDREALEAIAAILKDDSKHEDEKLEDIRLVIEANL